MNRYSVYYERFYTPGGCSGGFFADAFDPVAALVDAIRELRERASGGELEPGLFQVVVHGSTRPYLLVLNLAISPEDEPCRLM